MSGQPGRSGPRHKPSAIKKAEGNRGKRKIREEPLARGWPRVPLHLSSDERLIWSRLMKTMPAGVVTACDEFIVEAFCVSVSTYRQADELIRKSALMVRGSEGSAIANPLLRIRSRAFNEMRAGAIELGLTPAARARLVKVDVEPADPMEMLLGMDENAMQWGTSKQQAGGRLPVSSGGTRIDGGVPNSDRKKFHSVRVLTRWNGPVPAILPWKGP